MISHETKKRIDRQTHNPETTLPNSLLDEISAENHPQLRQWNGRTIVRSRKLKRKQDRQRKRQTAANAQRIWRERQTKREEVSNQDGASLSNSVKGASGRPLGGGSKTKNSKNQIDVTDELHSKKGENGSRAAEKQENSRQNSEQDVPHAQLNTIIESQKDTSGKKRKKDDQSEEPVSAINGSAHDMIEDDPDARQIKRLEKLLGITRKRQRNSAIGKQFSYSDVFGDGEDALVDLLEFCDNRKSRTTVEDDSLTGVVASTEDHLASPSASSQDHGDDDDSSDKSEEGGRRVNHLSEDDVNLDDIRNKQASLNTSEVADFEQESDSSEEQRSDWPSKSESEDGGLQAVTEESPPPSLSRAEQRQSIRSRNNAESDSRPDRDSSACRSARYVPPGARQDGSKTTNAIKRRLRGLLNRVADVNAAGIANELTILFRTSGGGLSRRELSSLYATAALDASRDGSGIGQTNPYVKSHAAIATHLGKEVDGVVLATLVLMAVRRLVTALQECDSQYDISEQESGGLFADDSSRDNAFGYVALLCALFMRRAVTTAFMYDILKYVANNMNGTRLELLLFILRQTGAFLRVEDPVGLKSAIEWINEQAAKIRTMLKSDKAPKVHISETKLQVMLDLVNDIKNNKIRRAALREAQAEFNWASTPDAPIGASINDLLDDDFAAMRWWDDTKGLSLAELRGKSELSSVPGEQNSGFTDSGSVALDEGPDLMTLASSLRLNTDFRRALFRAIMSSANFNDAVERLEGMSAFDLKNGHARDTALVILHCCASEKHFNPFYAVLAEKFCRRARRLRFTMEFALWDVFKTIPGSAKVAPMIARKRSHYANLLSRLWDSEAMSLSVLRCVPDFEACADIERNVYIDATVKVLNSLFKRNENRLQPFQKLRAETWNGVDDFRVSFALFVRKYVVNQLSKDVQDLALQAADLLEGTAEGAL